ncbi:expressed unknown protein [Seminavis robusta]|uniref:Sm domain-containing protein n=1 Tax=Seminavis robusta TaxID=568900 RepID=A0A9N8HQC3_9STRA|nr:expressed unknown protein [Seminavis robusta]|eukprot:Sro970_g226360.1 n/a (135) ;mRNA; f:23728-24324
MASSSEDDYYYHQPHAMGVTSSDIPADAVTSKPIPTDPAELAMYKLLGARLKCTLSDGRTATGTFICLDRLKNMILMDVIERRVINRVDYSPEMSPKEFPVQRELAQAMIPGKHLVKVEMEKEVYQKRLPTQNS